MCALTRTYTFACKLIHTRLLSATPTGMLSASVHANAGLAPELARVLISQTYLNQDNVRKKKRIANICAQIVTRGFWNCIHKVQKFQKMLSAQQTIKENQQKRLQNLVQKQLDISNKVASLLKKAEINIEPIIEAKSDHLLLAESHSQQKKQQED